MNETLSDPEAALMGLLSERPMHPYQVEQEMRKRDMRSWTDLSMSSIYKLLRKLEKDGMVLKKKEVSPGNRLRKLYSLTGTGEQKLRGKLLSLLSEPESMRWRFDIGIYFSGIFPDREVGEALDRYRRALREKISAYRELQVSLENSGSPLRRQALAIRPVYLMEAEIAWINAYLNRLK